jgi:2-hydroxychromene-2-carboxylate isomerase
VKRLGVEDARLASPEVKDALRKNTEAAAARGVFGVPTWEVDGELFWGADALGFAKAFLADPAALRNAEMRRADALPVGAARKG